MTNARVEVLTIGRRRRWARSDNEKLVALSMDPGASVSQVAHSAGLHVSQLFRWRKELCDRVPPTAPALIPVEVIPLDSSQAPRAPHRPARTPRGAGVIEIALSGGRRVRVDRDVDVEALRLVLDVLSR